MQVSFLWALCNHQAYHRWQLVFWRKTMPHFVSCTWQLIENLFVYARICIDKLLTFWRCVWTSAWTVLVLTWQGMYFNRTWTDIGKDYHESSFYLFDKGIDQNLGFNWICFNELCISFSIQWIQIWYNTLVLSQPMLLFMWKDICWFNLQNCNGEYF